MAVGHRWNSVQKGGRREVDDVKLTLGNNLELTYERASPFNHELALYHDSLLMPQAVAFLH